LLNQQPFLRRRGSTCPPKAKSLDVSTSSANLAGRKSSWVDLEIPRK
jgi:hypothetical protein